MLPVFNLTNFDWLPVHFRKCSDAQLIRQTTEVIKETATVGCLGEQFKIMFHYRCSKLHQGDSGQYHLVIYISRIK